MYYLLYHFIKMRACPLLSAIGQGRRMISHLMFRSNLAQVDILFLYDRRTDCASDDLHGTLR